MKTKVVIYTVMVLSLYLLSSYVVSTTHTGSALGNESNLVPIQNSYIPFLLNNSKQIGMINPDTSIFVSIALKYSNQSELNSFMSSVNNPTSPLYHHYLTLKQFDEKYSPSAYIYNSLVNYLKSNGITIEETWKDRTSISIIANASLIEKVFNTQLGIFQTNLPGLRSTFYAPIKPFYLPSVYYRYIYGIDGATNAFLYSLNIANIKKVSMASGNPLFTGTTNQLITGSDLQKAYGTIELYNNSAYAAPSTEHIFANGTTIATILWEGVNDSGGILKDVAPFDPAAINQYFKETLPKWEINDGAIPHIWGMGDKWTVAPGTSAAKDISETVVENTLDLEMVGSLAPGASIVNIYAPFNRTGFPDNEYNMAVSLANLTAISNSWGTIPEGIDYTVNNDIEQLNARGVTVFASSGDSPATPFPAWPASLAYNNFGVVSVGGLTLKLNGVPSIDGTGTDTLNPIQSQAIWFNASEYGGVGTQAGPSQVYKIPVWQDIPSVIDNGGSSEYRNVADISAVGNNTLIFIDDYPIFGNYSYNPLSVAGTSVSSPVEAGLFAEISSYLGVFYGNKTGLGFLDPLLYQLGPNNTLYNSMPFYNVKSAPPGYPYPALSGWNYGSGWGSVNAWNFTMAIKFVMSIYPDYQIIKLPKSETTVNYKIYVDYPYIYNSSVKINISGLPKGVAVNPSSGPFILNPPPNNGSMATSNILLNVSSLTPAGTYKLYIEAINYNPKTNIYGNLSVVENVTLVITNNQTYKVTFNQSSIPEGNPWEISFDGSTNLSTTQSMNFTAINGTYGYTIYYSYKGKSTRYAPIQSNGQISVKGDNVQINLSYDVQYYFNIDINPWNGGSISPTSSWYIAGSKIQITAKPNNIAVFDRWIGSGNGSYNGSSKIANVTMNGEVSETALFSIVMYPVTFIENGLPSGSKWNVTLHGLNESSNGNTIVFNETNGTYSYKVTTFAKDYSPEHSTGIVNVSGAPNAVLTTINVPNHPGDVVYDPANQLIYTTNWNSSGNYITVINPYTNKISTILNVTNILMPNNIVYNPYNKLLYVYGMGNPEDVVLVINSTNSVVKTINIPGNQVYPMTYDSQNRYIYLVGANDSYNDVYVLYAISPTFTLSNVTVLPGSFYDMGHGIIYNPSNNLIYVAMGNTHNVDVVNVSTDSVIKVIQIGNGTQPESMAFDPLNKDIYVMENYLSNVFIINSTTNSFTKNITVGLYPTNSIYDPANGCMYVVNYGSDSVSIVNGLTNTVFNNISVGQGPWSIAYDNFTHKIYVTNYWSPTGSVSVINEGTTQYINFVKISTYSLYFKETGLPKGVQWNITLNGTLYTTKNTTISFTEPNGSYTFTIENISGYTVKPSKGIAVINGKNTTINVTFTNIKPIYYTVIFEENGLPHGIEWSVTLGNITLNSTSGVIEFMVYNGSYKFKVGNISGYVVNPDKGNITVKGSNETIIINFSQIKTTSNNSTTSNENVWVYLMIAIIIIEAILIIVVITNKNKKKQTQNKKDKKEANEKNKSNEQK
ncbi:MAG: protease pro-enzyme activation domain-containing protein [Thermoplasmata archaeon]